MANVYGLPFQGSKNKLAERIIEVLPRAEHFYDLFAGGCAISHCALLSGKWKHIHISDINDSVILFRDALDGNLPDGSEWISREEFYLRKDTDPYIRLVWSFASNQRDYIYSREIEPYKKAVHEMIYAPTPNERRLKFKEVCRLMEEMYIISNQENTPPPNQNLQHDTNYQRLHHVCNQWRGYYPPQLSDIQRITINGASASFLESDQRNNRCREALSMRPFLRGEYDTLICDYREVEILPNSIIYCDIPYKDTREYKYDTFDHEAFYDWAEAQEAPVFVSEYTMPEDRFKCIAEWERISTFSATNNALKKVEKLFVPNKWYDKFKPIEQKSLFDDI